MFFRNIGRNQLIKATLFAGSMLLLDHAINNMIDQPHYGHHHHQHGHNMEDNIAHFIVQLTSVASTVFIEALRFGASAVSDNNVVVVSAAEFVTSNWVTPSSAMTTACRSLFGGAVASGINKLLDPQPQAERAAPPVRFA